MKKFVALLAALSLLISLAACGQAPAADEGTIPNQSSESMAATPTDKNIDVRFSDLQSTLDNFEHVAASITNNSDQYLTAELHLTVTDQSGKQIGEHTVFLDNMNPKDYTSTPFLAERSSEYNFSYDIVDYKFSETFATTPEVNDTNVKQYIRITSTDYGVYSYDHSKRELGVDVYNRTDKYFTGEVRIVAKDASGTILDSTTYTAENSKPFSSSASKVLAVPLDADYVLDYEILSYSFTADPSVNGQNSSQGTTTVDDKQNYPNFATFGVSAESFLSTLSTVYSGMDTESKYGFTVNLTPEANPEKIEATASLPATTVTYYNLIPGIKISTSTQDSTGDLYNVAYIIEKNKLESTEAQKFSGATLACMLLMFEYDTTTQDKIEDELALSDITTERNAVSVGTTATWVYNVTDTQVVLHILA